mgnify:CR=1 FL=1
MQGKKRYSPRKLGTILDAAHIAIGICVVLMAIFAFFDPERYMYLFPLIFLLASVLNFLTGWFYIRMYPRVRKKKAAGSLYMVIGTITALLCIISAVAIYRNI